MSDSRDTRRAYGVCGLLGALAALLLAPSPAGAVDPGVAEYSLNFPSATGKSYPGADAPTADPAELDPFVRQALSDSDRTDGKALAALATAPELGAPGSSDTGPGSGSGERLSGETPSVPTAAFRALSDVAVMLGLLALLGVIAFLAFLARTRPTGKEA